MVVVEPVFTEVALEHEVLDIQRRVGLLAMTVYIEESVTVLVLIIHIIFFLTTGVRLLFNILIVAFHI